MTWSERIVNDGCSYCGSGKVRLEQMPYTAEWWLDCTDCGKSKRVDPE